MWFRSGNDDARPRRCDVAEEEYELVASRLPQQVFDWRFGALLAAGFDPETAKVFADDPNVDLHVAVALIAGGCDPDTAVRILA